jgi:hypothetical protein
MARHDPRAVLDEAASLALLTAGDVDRIKGANARAFLAG